MLKDKRKKIEVINRGRGTGRTTELIRRCAKHNYALIVTPSKTRARFVFEQARSQGIYIPFPITFKEFCGGEFCGKNVDAFLFDDLDDTLKERAMWVPIEAVVIEGDETNTGDLISRQSVKDWLLKWEGYIDKDIIARMQYRVIDIPSAQPEQRWIPCSERLPEDEKEVLVTRHFLSDTQLKKNAITEAFYVEVASRIGDEWTSYSDEYKIKAYLHKVIAWMPLPEPYRAERREE